MFYKLFALFAVFAVAFAAPKANPQPQIAYSSDYLYPAAAGVPYVSGYNVPFASLAPLAPVPYSAYPYPNTVFFK